MNERIKELAEQAGIVFWEMSGDVDWRQANTETLGKFAELIVRECCVVILADPRLGDVRSATRGCARSIKEHFGVE